MADDTNARDSFVGQQVADVEETWAKFKAQLSIEGALKQLKDAEGRLIYAKHALEQEYSRVFCAVKEVKRVVDASVVLPLAEYDRLLRAIRDERHRAAAVAGGAGAGAGARATDAPAHTCARRSPWNYDSCAGCRHQCDAEFDAASSVSCEDSE